MYSGTVRDHVDSCVVFECDVITFLQCHLTFFFTCSNAGTRFVGRTFGIIIAVECLSDDENIETNLLNTILSHSEQGTSVYVSWDSVYCDEESYLRFLAKCMSYFHVSIIPIESILTDLEKVHSVRLVVMSRR